MYISLYFPLTFLFYNVKKFRKNAKGMFQHQLPQVCDQVTFSLLQLWQEADCWELLKEQISACWTLPVPRADQKPGGAPDSSPQALSGGHPDVSPFQPSDLQSVMAHSCELDSKRAGALWLERLDLVSVGCTLLSKIRECAEEWTNLCSKDFKWMGPKAVGLP